MIYKGNHKLGDFFTSRRERGTPGLPMLSVTMNNGVVTRESLDRKMETNLSDEEHLLVRKDDIAYNMMRMWQGASGLADRDGLLSPAYVVLAPKKGIDPLYASYLFKTPRLIYLFWAYSYGLTSDRLRLYFNDFKIIPVDIPSLVEQKEVSKILSICDKEISVSKLIIENNKLLLKGLMQQFFTEQLRLNKYKNIHWRPVELRSLGNTFGGLAGKSSEHFGLGKSFIPYINIFNNSKIDIGNLDLVDILPSEKQNKVKYGDIFFTTSSETPGEVGMSSVLLDEVEELYLNSFCFGFRLHDFNSLSPKFARFLFRSAPVRKRIALLAQGSTRFNLPKSELMKIVLKLPPIEEQEAIAEILENTENQIVISEQYHAQLLLSKKSLIQKLLTGKRRVKVDES